MKFSSGTDAAPDWFAAEVLRRLPLAEAFYTAWGHLASDAVLDALFDRRVKWRGNQYVVGRLTRLRRQRVPRSVRRRVRRVRKTRTKEQGL